MQRWPKLFSKTSAGDHADTDDDEDEETGGMFDPHHTRHTPAAHTHTRADGEL